MCFYVSTRVRRALNAALQEIVQEIEESLRCGAHDRPELPATLHPGQRDPQSLQWGLIPHWARNAEHALELQALGRNARSETMFEKPMFRDAARHGRCLIWLDGFYEWQHRGKKRVQYLVHMPGRQLFPVAGLRSIWTDPQSGQVFDTCTIVTTSANELMSEINNSRLRMPVIVQPQHQAAWLDPALGPDALQACIQPLPDGILIAEALVDPEPPAPPTTSLSLF